jgi:hypothetical protein
MALIPLAVSSVLKLLGSKMGVRLLLLLVVGLGEICVSKSGSSVKSLKCNILGALYTIHLLAGDWMKIQGAGAGAAAGK